MKYLDFVKKDKKVWGYAFYFLFLCVADCWMAHRLVTGETFLKPDINDVIICMSIYLIVLIAWIGFASLKFNVKLPGYNSFEHSLELEDRYTLVSFTFLAEVRSYLLAATIAIYSLGAAHAFSGAKFTLSNVILMIVMYILLLGRVLRQPEHYSKFLSKEYVLLFSECYYRVKKRNIRKKFEELISR